MALSSPFVRGCARRRARSAILFLLAACGDGTGPDGAGAHVSARIDGSVWTANYQVDVAVGDLLANGDLHVVGLEVAPDAAGRQITLVIRGFDGPGSYAIDAPDAGGSYAYHINSPNTHAPPTVRDAVDARYVSHRAGAGVVTVTSYVAATGRIAGTFAFEAATLDGPTRLVAVSEGSFVGRVVRAP